MLVATPIVAVAEDKAYLTEQELQQAYQRALKNFGSTAVLPDPATAQTPQPQQSAQSPASATVAPVTPAPGVRIGISDTATAFGSQQGDQVPISYLPLGSLRVSLNVENLPLEDVMQMIVDQAQPKVGPWGVKWRLDEDNRNIMNERVNLTAESSFDEFMSYMTDRVNNMTGVRLFIRVFDDARLILITDSY